MSCKYMSERLELIDLIVQPENRHKILLHDSHWQSWLQRVDALHARLQTMPTTLSQFIMLLGDIEAEIEDVTSYTPIGPYDQQFWNTRIIALRRTISEFDDSE